MWTFAIQYMENMLRCSKHLAYLLEYIKLRIWDGLSQKNKSRDLSSRSHRSGYV